jgi:hypothetical protein
MLPMDPAPTAPTLPPSSIRINYSTFPYLLSPSQVQIHNRTHPIPETASNLRARRRTSRGQCQRPRLLEAGPGSERRRSSSERRLGCVLSGGRAQEPG